MSRLDPKDTPLLLLDEPTSALDLRWQTGALAAVREAAGADARALVGGRGTDRAAFARARAGGRRTHRTGVITGVGE